MFQITKGAYNIHSTDVRLVEPRKHPADINTPRRGCSFPFHQYLVRLMPDFETEIERLYECRSSCQEHFMPFFVICRNYSMLL